MNNMFYMLYEVVYYDKNNMPYSIDQKGTMYVPKMNFMCYDWMCPCCKNEV